LSVVRGKTDQEAAGQVVGVVATDSLTCPVAALRTWLEAADITDGAVFRAIDRHSRIATGLSDRAIALIVMTAAGVDPTATRRTRCAPAAGHDSARHSVGGTGGVDTQVPIPAQSLAGDSCSVADQGVGPASSP
jgi:hypothetical protein